jgi:hypothetical protein
MAEQKGGGFVISMKTRSNVVGQIPINDAMLRKVCEALGIPQKAPNVKVDEHYSDIETIYIYRGA